MAHPPSASTSVDGLVHESAVIDEGAVIGEGTRVWHFSHVMKGARIGRDSSLGQNVFVASSAVVGDRVKVQNNVSIYDGVTVDDDAFIGPSAVFTNVASPRAFLERKHEYAATRIGKGASVGAGAVIVCGNEVGDYAMVGAGAVVSRPVAPHALVVGNPARRIGWVSRAGRRLSDGARATCSETGDVYAIDGESCALVDSATVSHEDAIAAPRPVEMADLRALHAPLTDALRNAFDRVASSARFIGGEEVEAFEREIADRCGVEHAVGVSSGTDALLVALTALEIGPGDEVITTPLSFFATVGVIARLGATPVFADIGDDLTLDVDAARAAITERTRAILPVHLFGKPVNEGIYELAREKGLAVVDDAAQALGASSRSGRVGSLGDCGCFSFFPTKNLGALGDAGAVTTHDGALAERMRILRAQGASARHHHTLLGGNFRLDALQAALLRAKLPFFDGWSTRRKANALAYERALAPLARDGRLTLPIIELGHAVHQYVVRTQRRDGLRAHLAEQRIASEVYYPEPLHLQPCLSHLPSRAGSFPRAERACLDSLALPVHPTLSQADIERVCQEIAVFYAGHTAS